jgi:hypothetical protein
MKIASLAALKSDALSTASPAMKSDIVNATVLEETRIRPGATQDVIARVVYRYAESLRCHHGHVRSMHPRTNYGRSRDVRYVIQD